MLLYLTIVSYIILCNMIDYIILYYISDRIPGARAATTLAEVPSETKSLCMLIGMICIGYMYVCVCMFVCTYICMCIWGKLHMRAS